MHNLNMIDLQRNVLKVMDKLRSDIITDEGLAEDFADCLEVFLDEVACDDGFGTERQNDPRGDMRIKEWSIYGEIQ